MSTLINDYKSINVNEMSYDEFCIAAFGIDSDELKERENGTDRHKIIKNVDIVLGTQ